MSTTVRGFKSSVSDSLKGYSKEDIGSIIKGDLPKPKGLRGVWLNDSLEFKRVSGDPRSPVYLDSLTQLINFREGYLGFLDRFFEWEIFSKVKCCSSLFREYWCEAGSHYVVRPIGCNERRICPKCADRYTWSKVEFTCDLFKRIDDRTKFGVYLTHMVLTTPDILWVYIKNNEDRFFKVKDRLFRRLGNGLSGGVSAFHMWRSEDPLRGYFPHIHSVVPNIILRKNGGIWYFRRSRPYFNLDRLKRIYFEELCREFKECEELRFFDYEKIDVWVRYLSLRKENRVKHLLKYVFRLPISDFKSRLIPNLDSETVKFVMESIFFKKKRVRWFGFLADGVKRKYLDYLGVRWVRYAVWVKMRELLCPVHGSPLVKLGSVISRSELKIDGG